MAKLTRPSSISVFASAALSSELTIFGADTESTNINLILNGAYAERGWGVVGANGFPPMEWFNAMGYSLSYYSSYLMQQGIAEWVSTQNYYVNSRCVGSDGKEYVALTGVDGTPNIGNNPTADTTNWSESYKKFIPAAINAATSKTTPVDADLIGIADSAASFALKKLTLANLKSALTSLFAPTENPTFTGTVSLDTNATLVFEGSSADAYETTLSVENPTADRTITFPNESGTVSLGIQLGTAVSASSTAIYFTSIPNGVKRIDVVFTGLSTNGTSIPLLRVGSVADGVKTSGYSGSTTGHSNTSTGTSTYSNGLGFRDAIVATDSLHGIITLDKITSNNWVMRINTSSETSTKTSHGVSFVSLAGELDRIILTTVNGTDTFDAGSINIMWEF